MSNAMNVCNNEFKCLDTKCNGCQNIDTCSEMEEIGIDCSSIIKSDAGGADLKCWCNREDCCMYMGSNYDSEYGLQNSDIMLSDMSDQNYKRRYMYNNLEYLCTESSATTSTDESMTSLDSGIKTVIHESVSSKDASSLPKDIEDDINKNECSRAKAACSIT